MAFEHIEKLQREYTDKFVVVDDQRPELRRFKDMTGFVKTVNMSGRALVQFDRATNIGWYDIVVDFLKVVDKPQEADQGKKAVALIVTLRYQPEAQARKCRKILACASG